MFRSSWTCNFIIVIIIVMVVLLVEKQIHRDVEVFIFQFIGTKFHLESRQVRKKLKI